MSGVRISNGSVSKAPSDVDRLLDYDPRTGCLTWKIDRGRGVCAGDSAGWVSQPSGYRMLRINGRPHMAHRVAWLLNYGEWPGDQIDHINGDRGDNRIANLRLATNSENAKNRKIQSNNRSGVAGVCWHRRGKKWVAQIRVNGRRRHLGYFVTKHEAIAARRQAEAQYFGAFAHNSAQESQP